MKVKMVETKSQSSQTDKITGSLSETSELDSLYAEWKETRKSIGRFDSISVDLRKYGFSFVTLVISSSSILFDAAKLQNPLPLVVIPVVIALLTLSLFLADSYYQVLLLASVLHARHLENIHKEILSENIKKQMYFGLNLTNYLQDKIQKTRAHFYMIFVYLLFIAIASLFGYFSLWAYHINFPSFAIGKFYWILSIGISIILIFLIIISRGVSRLLAEMNLTEVLDNRFVIQKIFEKKDVEFATKQIAQKVYKSYKKSGFKVLTLGMGGMYFANSLIGELKKRGMSNIELITAFSEREGNQVSIEYPEKSDVAGENILIVDDLVSTGITMQAAIDLCQTLEAKSIRTCALLDAYKKRHPDASDWKLDYWGLRSSESKRFFVGSGLDGGKKMSPESRDKVRLLPYIGIVVASPNNSDQEFENISE